MLYQVTQMDARWTRIQDVFIAAAELPGTERSAFLKQACGADLDLRAEVESLLAAEDGAHSFVEGAFGQAVTTLTDVNIQPRNRTAGAYRILGEIGRGGMGAVYLAERADQQFRKQVAIKLARFAGNGEFLLERFRHERQILATLEHPNIARLLDGGETEDGVPYIVMEYIQGRPLTEYIREHGLSLPERLKLFLKIAGAVQYAHRFLVIHRDLKPGNILVTESGDPKLLDFGIAKLLEPGAMGEAIMYTSTGMHLLTPDYASPEQVRGEPVTTASDVYSLGAVLFEMLTGAKPHRIRDYTPIEIDRAVCQTETERPSEVAARKEVPSHIDSELDVVVLEAMHKDPARRYASVEHLADDIRRYLDGRPILARGDSRAYRARKFVIRHRVAATAAALVFVSLLAAIAGTSWQASVARKEARRAEVRFRQVRQLANRFLLDFDEQIRNLEGSTPAREALVSTARQYLNSLAVEAGKDNELRTELAIAYRKLGEVEGGPRAASLGRSHDALRSYTKSLEIGRDLFNTGMRDPILLETIIESERMLGLLEHRLIADGGDAKYEQRLSESARLAEILVEKQREVRTLRILASIYRELGERFADTNRAMLAEQRYTQALPIYQEVRRLAPEPRSDDGLFLMTQRLGDAKVMRGDIEAAVLLYRTALAGFQRLAGLPKAGQRERRRLMAAHLSLGALFGDSQIPNLGQTSDAIDQTRAGLDIAERLERADPANRTAKLDLAYTVAQYGRVLRARDPAEASAHLRRAIALAEQVWAASPKDHVYLRHVLRYKTDLGITLAGDSRPASGVALLEAVVRDIDGMQAPPFAFTLIGAEALRESSLAIRRTRPVEARRMALEAVNRVESYLLRRLDSIEMADDLSLFYQAAAHFEPGFANKARQLWIEWPKRGHSSNFDRRRLEEINASSRR